MAGSDPAMTAKIERTCGDLTELVI